MYFILKTEPPLRAVRLGGAGRRVSGPLISSQNDVGERALSGVKTKRLLTPSSWPQRLNRGSRKERNRTCGGHEAGALVNT